MTGRVTGIGGVFFKARDPMVLAAWYREHLGLPDQGWPGCAFDWREAGTKARRGMTIWAPHAADTGYFAPSEAAFMINYRVDDLEALVAKLEAAGVAVERQKEPDPNGKFAWLIDPEGNKIELWEPLEEDGAS